MSEPSAAGSQQRQSQQPSRGVLMPLGIALVGGVLTVGALMLVSGRSDTVSAPGASDLATVAVNDIAAATQTIAPAVAGGLAAEAKDCRVPLARVMISKAPGSAGGTVQIRSGNYMSPSFELTDAPQQVAIPFPAPYPTGRGVIGVIGNASGVVISLYPAWTAATVNGTAVHNVVWNPNKPCS